MARGSRTKHSSSPAAEASTDADERDPEAGETQFSAHESDDPDNFFDVECILDERDGRYLLKWKGTDPKTGRPWKPSWEPKTNCTPGLITEWKKKQRKKRAEASRGPPESEASGSTLKPSSSRSSLRSAAAAKPVVAKPASTRPTRKSDTSKSRPRMSQMAVEIPVQRLGQAHIPSKRRAGAADVDNSPEEGSRRTSKRARQSPVVEMVDSGEESEELGVVTRSKRGVVEAKPNGTGKTKHPPQRAASRIYVDEPIELSSGSGDDDTRMENEDAEDEDEDLKPFSRRPLPARSSPPSASHTGEPVKIGPPRGKKKQKQSQPVPASQVMDLDSPDMNIPNDEVSVEEVDESDGTESTLRRRIQARKRERPSILSESSSREVKKRKVDHAATNHKPTPSPDKSKTAHKVTTADVIPDSQSQSITYSTTQSTPSKSQQQTTDTYKPMRSLVDFRGQITPSKFIRKKGGLDSSDVEAEIPQTSTQIESFSSPSQPKKSMRPQPLQMRSVASESSKAASESIQPVQSDDAWAATGWTGDGSDQERLPGETTDMQEPPGETADDMVSDLPAVGSGQHIEQESEITTEEVAEPSEAAAASVETDGNRPEAHEVEMVEVAAVDEFLDGGNEEDLRAEVIIVEQKTEKIMEASQVDIVETVERVEILVPGTASAREEETSDLVLPAFDDHPPEVQAALELAEIRQKELDLAKAEKLAESTRRDALQRKYDELAKERDMFKQRCKFLTEELFQTDVGTTTAEAGQTPASGVDRVTAAYAAAGAPASQEELDAMQLGSNTNSTQDEIVTLRSQLDVVVAERDELKVCLRLVQGTEASLRAVLDERMEAVKELTDQVIRLTKQATDNDSEMSLLREVWTSASSAAAESKSEADTLREQNTILRGQIKEGVASARLFHQARVKDLEEKVKQYKAMAELQTKRADRSELVEIRQRAAKEPMLQQRIRNLKAQVEELEAENADLDKQVKAARAERLLGRPLDEERKRREALEMGLNDGLAEFEPDEMVFRCEWWETLDGRCRAVYRTKGELWDHILSSDHIGMNS